MRSSLLTLLCMLLCPLGAVADDGVRLQSGDVTLCVNKNAEADYTVRYALGDVVINPDDEYNPTLVVDVKTKVFFLHYTDCQLDNGVLTLTARQKLSPSTIDMEIVDRYEAAGDGAFTLQRTAKVLEIGARPYYDNTGFYTSFGMQLADEDALLDYEYFVPGLLYKSHFDTEANMPASDPKADATSLLYRDDRTTLPVIMMRHKTNGLTVQILDADSPSETILADATGLECSADYNFGGVGVVKRSNTKYFAPVATWPGSDKRAGGLGERRHPFDTDLQHSYKVYFKIGNTPSYQSAFYETWENGCREYSPEIRYEDQQHAYEALLHTMNHYYLDPNGANESNFGAQVHRPGFPWSVYLYKEYTDATTYEVGFVGAQVQAGLAMLRAGGDMSNSEYFFRGRAVLDFWAGEGLSEQGFPKSRYYSVAGRWDSGAMTSVRQASTGMCALLEGWCFMKKHGEDKTAWLDACKRYGDWLCTMQNRDGSWYMEYNPFSVSAGKHPAGKQNKMLTICGVRYLVELYIVTKEEKYLTAAMKAAEFCYTKQHQNWLYAACVIDNPQLLDSESGQQALNAFLALYDLTGEERWLEAAEQAAMWTASFTYMHEVPVEKDQTGETTWPKDMSIVGQHYITAAGFSATDLGFAWSSFALYRLYIYTGKDIYLTMARVSAHNSKQSMNLHQRLYPGKEEGLQQEAFRVATTGHGRRLHSVMEALTWNYAAHVEPMIRFLDAFGTVDIEEVEKLSAEEKKQFNERYAQFQSCDYGQEPTKTVPVTGHGDGLKGEYWKDSSDFGNPIPDIYKNTDWHTSPEQDQGGTLEFTRVDPTIDYNWGMGNPFDDTTDECSFSIKWTGFLLAPVTGQYVFDLTRCDDAFSLTLWDVENERRPVVRYDKEYLKGWNWDKSWWLIPAQLEEGKVYRVQLLYYDNVFGAHIHFKWFINGCSAVSEIVPQAQLYSERPDLSSVQTVGQSFGGESFYTVSGMKIYSENLTPGLYIVKNGTESRKVIIK